jgi:hypothetical protein
MRNDPHLGAGSYGQTARFCPERTYIMHKLLSDLEERGWKEKPEFAHFLKLVPGVSYAGEISAGGREFVENVPDQFIETYRYYLKKHALTPWRLEKLVVLMVAGDKVFAKHFLKRVFNPSYRFPNQDIVLVHHETDHSQVSVNILEALDYLIGEHQVDSADESNIYNDPFIQDQLSLWRDFADGLMDVDLFDKTTWSDGKDYTPLYDHVIRNIAPLAA